MTVRSSLRNSKTDPVIHLSLQKSVVKQTATLEILSHTVKYSMHGYMQYQDGFHEVVKTSDQRDLSTY